MKSITFLGDVFLNKPFRSEVEFENYIPNLEAPITKSNNPVAGKINLKAPDLYMLETFGKLPFAVCLANNHILDYGIEGYEDTLIRLAHDNIPYWGAGYVSENCKNPLTQHIDGLQVANIGYVCRSTSPVIAREDSPGVSLIDPARVINMVAALKKDGNDRVIVHFHWGAEEVGLPKPEDVKIARAVIDSGADLIIGHHAHIKQPYENYQGRYIFYGLGNCIFPNLNIEANYDEETKSFQRRYQKRQKPWNLKSYAVKYTPLDNRVEVLSLQFVKNMLIPDGEFLISPNSTFITSKSVSLYNKKFKRSYIWGKMRTILLNYIFSPKLVRFKHLKGILTIFKAKTYS
jgi:poly-gamma-glutamate synthesis protein (capsule biosynthesis protein)